MDPSTTSLHVTGMAIGGDGVARDRSGRVVLVTGALPGETVTVRDVRVRRKQARATVAEVVEAAPERVAPPCPFVAAGCGGCGWQHVAVPAQRSMKADLVVDALRRLGGVTDPSVSVGARLPPAGYRTTIRGVADPAGRLALRRARGHEPVAVPDCRVAHPLVAEVLAGGRFPPGAEVTVRAGAGTGERLVVVDRPPGAERAVAGHEPGGAAVAGVADAGVADAVGTEDAGNGAHRPGDVVVPAGVRVVEGGALAAGQRAWIHETVAGHRLRVSARSFFQPGRAGAEALATAVTDGVGDVAAGGHLVDLYGGVALFAATVGAGARVTLVEASASAAADARVNLADREARVVRVDVARWRPRRADVVVADPPRIGLGAAGVRAAARTGAARLVLVSCDAGALGRDARLLAGAGYRFVSATVVDQFGHTPHVEVVSRFDRSPGRVR